MKNKTIWVILLLINIFLFFYGIIKSNPYISIIALVLAIIIKRNGKDILNREKNKQEIDVKRKGDKNVK